MDQDPRTAGSQVGAREAPPEQQDEQRAPEEIRADIEQTREEVGDTVEALAAKADVKAQAKQRFDEVKSNVRAKKDELTAKGGASAGAQQGGRQVVDKARENPAPVALAAAALFGFFVSRLTDRRRGGR
jgi:Protein of unknown function (DUF3618)